MAWRGEMKFISPRPPEEGGAKPRERLGRESLMQCQIGRRHLIGYIFLIMAASFRRWGWVVLGILKGADPLRVRAVLGEIIFATKIQNGFEKKNLYIFIVKIACEVNDGTIGDTGT